jgi:anti-anti-sigma regulatory factor
MKAGIFNAIFEDILYIQCLGVLRYHDSVGLDQYIEQLFDVSNKDNTFKHIKMIVINLECAEMLDSTMLGILAKIAIGFKKKTQKEPFIFIGEGELNELLKRICFDRIFFIISHTQWIKRPEKEVLDLKAIKNVSVSEETLFQLVLDAHHHLSKISPNNAYYYNDLLTVT